MNVLNARRLLVIGTWDMREAALNAWADAGLEVTLVDHSASTRPGPAAHRIDLDVWDSASPDLAELTALARESDGVVTLAEFCAGTAARVAHDAGLPGPGRQAAALARDKGALRQHLAQAGLPGPRFATVTTAAEVEAFFAALGDGDAVVKPADSAGSTAVFHVRSAAEAIAVLPQAVRWSFSGRALLEEYVDGREFSVEATVVGGATRVVAIVEKATLPGGFIEVRHVVPATLGADEMCALGSAAAAVVTALGIRDAVIHGEFRLGPEGFVLIEIAVRPAGGLIPDLLKLATGYDLYRAQAELALGFVPDPTALSAASCAGVQFATGTGTVADGVAIASLLRDHPGLARAGLLVTPGTEIGELDTNGVRAGYVMARARDRRTLNAVLDAGCADLTRRLGLDVGARVS